MSTFDFNGLALRVIQIDGEPWFVAIDVCRALGSYLTARGGVNTAMALSPLNGDEVRDLPNTNRIGVGGRRPKVISESGLYKLITRSDKPQAKPFQEWVTRDVLPSIRKTGSYSVTAEYVTTHILALDNRRGLPPHNSTKTSASVATGIFGSDEGLPRGFEGVRPKLFKL